jgi:hypothetical protein
MKISHNIASVTYKPKYQHLFWLPLLGLAFSLSTLQAHPFHPPSSSSSSLPYVPSFTLYNAARTNLQIPAIGLGTGGNKLSCIDHSSPTQFNELIVNNIGYATDPSVGYGGYPECWDARRGCGNFTVLILAYCSMHL